MKCPFCNNLIDENENEIKCTACEKSLKNIHLYLSQKEQGVLKYDKALFYLENAKKYCENEEEIQEIDRIIDRVALTKIEIEMYGDDIREKEKNIFKIIKNLFFASLLIFCPALF